VGNSSARNVDGTSVPESEADQRKPEQEAAGLTALEERGHRHGDHQEGGDASDHERSATRPVADPSGDRRGTRGEQQADQRCPQRPR
jgi:hypothetical protein